MRLRTFVVCLFFVLISLHPLLSSEFKTGNDLLALCEKKGRQQAGENLPTSDCMDLAFFQGFLSGIVSMNSTIASEQQVFTLPKDCSIGQISRVVHKYLNDHPERLHEPGFLLVLDALCVSFPSRVRSGR